MRTLALLLLAVPLFSQDAKPQKLTNPFEAFAYGTPKERQAAQDFISFEKKTGRQYDKALADYRECMQLEPQNVDRLRLVAWVLAMILDRTTPLPMRVPLTAVVSAIGVSTSVGLFFGVYPARKAARLNPIEALRAES